MVLHQSSQQANLSELSEDEDDEEDDEDDSDSDYAKSKLQVRCLVPLLLVLVCSRVSLVFLSCFSCLQIAHTCCLLSCCSRACLVSACRR